eukprot:5160564-Amphidinium_carterae.1
MEKISARTQKCYPAKSSRDPKGEGQWRANNGCVLGVSCFVTCFGNFGGGGWPYISFSTKIQCEMNS